MSKPDRLYLHENLRTVTKDVPLVKHTTVSQFGLFFQLNARLL